MERDPLNRYHDARELARDLEHQDQVVVGASAERHTSHPRRATPYGRLFPYLLLGLIPVFILALLLYVAGHS